MSLVFEEVRNLCLGLAARGVDWRAQGGRGSMEILGRLVVRLFGNLFQRSEKISQVGVGGGGWGGNPCAVAGGGGGRGLVVCLFGNLFQRSETFSQVGVLWWDGRVLWWGVVHWALRNMDWFAWSHLVQAWCLQI